MVKPTLYHINPDSGGVFVSLENARLRLADVRKALPGLQAELQKDWPTITDVDIESRRLRLRNPFHGTISREMLEATGIVLAVRFAVSATDAAGKEFGKDVARGVIRYVRRWIRKFDQPSAKKNRARAARKSKRPAP